MWQIIKKTWKWWHWKISCQKPWRNFWATRAADKAKKRSHKQSVSLARLVSCVVLEDAKKIFFCSGMIERNATDHFHVQFTVKNNFAWRYRIEFCKETILYFSWISQFRSKILWCDESNHLLLAIDNLKNYRLYNHVNFISGY